MNRSIYYSGEQLRSFDLASFEKDALADAGGLELFLSGQTTTMVGGLTATATSPTSLTVDLTQGWIAQQAVMDANAFGSLPADSTVVQQFGYAPAQQVQLSTAGLSSGQSRWALIEAQFAQVDVIRASDPTGGLLNYYNSANPTQPLQGPGGNGQVQPTEREATISVRVVYGSPATTGSEAPPNVDTGWVGLYLVDLTFGQTAISQGQILVAGPSVGANVPSNYPGAPFIAGLLNQHHLGKPGHAPQIDLTAEVKNALPLSNLLASNTTGGLSVMRQGSGNPNGTVAGNANTNGVPDFYWDTLNKLLYVCTTTGTSSTAVWTTVAGQSTSIFAGGTSTGSANAQVVASTTPAGFAKTPGQVVTFTAGFANTGSATLNVDATGASAFNKNTGSGNVPLSGGEIQNGAFITVIWTGSVYLLQSQVLGTLATLNIGAWLKNDGSGNLTIKNGAGLGDDGSGNFTILASGVTAGTYTSPKITVGADGRLTAAANGAQSTFTKLTSGTGLYTTPANCKRLRIRMIGATGGGGASGSSTVNNGSNGTASVFGSTTANPGLPGTACSGNTAGTGGAGGTGGTTATGTEIIRLTGAAGSPGVQVCGGPGGGTTSGIGGAGGSSPFGGAGPAARGAGSNAAANSGSGAGGGANTSNDDAGGGGSGSGEYVEFFINSPAATYNYTVGASGTGGTASGGASPQPGGNGSNGLILIEEFYE